MVAVDRISVNNEVLEFGHLMIKFEQLQKNTGGSESETVLTILSSAGGRRKGIWR